MTSTTLLAILVIASLVPLAAAQTVMLELDSGSAEISYQGNGVDVQSVRQISDSLVFSVNVPDDSGSLEVVLDRNIIDAEKDGVDIEYLVLIDAFPSLTFSESETTDTSRTLQIPVPIFSTEIEIVGTPVGSSAPEPNMMEDDAMTGDAMTDDAMTGDVMTDDAMTGDVMTGDAMDGDAMTETPSTVCGSGTMFDSNSQTCVLVSNQSVSFKDLVFGAIAGFLASLIVMMVLYPISRIKRS